MDYFVGVNFVLKIINFGFELVILFFQIADEECSLLWNRVNITGHGVELLVELIKLKTLLVVKGLVVGHRERSEIVIFFF